MGLFKPLTTLFRKRFSEDSTQSRSLIPYLLPVELQAIHKGTKNELLSDSDIQDQLLNRIRDNVVDAALHSPSNRPLRTLYDTPPPAEAVPHLNTYTAINRHILSLEAEITKLRRETQSWADDFGEVQMELLEMRNYLYTKQMEVERLERQAKIDAAEINRLSLHSETPRQGFELIGVTQQSMDDSDVAGTSTSDSDRGDSAYMDARSTFDGKSVWGLEAGSTNTRAMFGKISTKIQSVMKIARFRGTKLRLPFSG